LLLLSLFDLVHASDIFYEFLTEIILKVDLIIAQDNNAFLETVEHSFELVFDAEAELELVVDLVLEVV
jgi:hypothetical protein